MTPLRSALGHARPAHSGTLGRQGSVLLTGMLVVAACLTSGCKKQRSPDTDESCSVSERASAEARLLTRSEYLRTARDLLGTELDPTRGFPPEPVVSGFENDASSHQANPLLVEKHAEAAARLALDLQGRGLDTIYACRPEDSKGVCAEKFIQVFGTRAYRRPPTPGEHASLQGLYERAATTLGHTNALLAVVEAMLQAPQFLYRVEAPISGQDEGRVQLGPFEMASRLSYFLWGTMPDPELMQAATQDALRTSEQVEYQARRLLADTRAVERAREFHSQWLGLSRLSSIARDGAPLGASESWGESIHRFIDGVFWGDTPTAHELFSSSTVHYDAALATLYDLEQKSGWASVTVDTERHGLLTQPGIMALFAHADQSSLIQRGVFVRENILCEEIQPPPPSVDNNPPDPDPELTTRERFSIHTESPACANCHRLIDPLGFGFESYDHLGRYRAQENGLDVDTSGEIVEVAEDALLGPFSDEAELSERLAESETVLSCLARKWFTFAMGRAHNESDNCSIEGAVAQAVSADGDLRELLVALTTSSAFRYRAAHESDTYGVAP